ncbi:MAG: maleylpyruvate isomerase N-terminal domain-containing protein, partial [Dehalococcoidia bacterium]
MMESPESRVQALHDEMERFKAYLDQMPATALDQPSACQGWTVADVIGHLTPQNVVGTIARGLQGDFGPPEGALPVSEHDEDRFAQNIFQRALDTKTGLGDGLIPTLVERLNASLQTFRAVKPGEWDTLCYWPPGPEPVRIMLDICLAELSMHIWDIRSRLDDEYHLADASVAGLMDAVNRAVRRAFRPDP